jgi:hypothetical protein
MAGIDRDVEANLEQWESVFSDNDPAARLEELTGDKYQRFQVCPTAAQRLHNGQMFVRCNACSNNGLSAVLLGAYFEDVCTALYRMLHCAVCAGM